MPSLAQSDAAVARTIAANPERVVAQSITELAEAAGTSASTVVRCSQRLGFAGFQDLRLALARELGAVGKLTVPDRRGDAPQAVLEYVLAMQLEAVRSVPATLDRHQFEAAVAALSEADRVVFAGMGANLSLIQDAGYIGRHIGLSVDAPLDIYTQQMAASLLGERDACVTISQTGSSHDSVATQSVAREAGATTVAVTGFLKSPLTGVSDWCLVAGNPAMTFELDSIPARMAMRAVLDSLLVAVALRNQGRTAEAWRRATTLQLRNIY
jgi:DNA-binding MurR/RpiR family transcriptional regulator